MKFARALHSMVWISVSATALGGCMDSATTTLDDAGRGDGNASDGTGGASGNASGGEAAATSGGSSSGGIGSSGGASAYGGESSGGSGGADDGGSDAGTTGGSGGSQDSGGTPLLGDTGCAACPPSNGLPPLRGVNLAGAEFGSVPGTYGSTYTYPTHAEVDSFVGLGMNVFRLPFRWERLQPAHFGSFDSAELARLDDFTGYATDQGAYVLLDPHNYARYYDAVVGDGVPQSAFADFWSKLATHYKDNARVLFGLMNEPHDMSTELWLEDANAAIAAIRDAGASNLITVPGNAWTGAHSWLQNWYGTPNGNVMVGIEDPLDNYVIEVHQYLDGDSSGTDLDNCVSPTIGSERLTAFTGWLEQQGRRAFLGEFGAGSTSTCLAAIDDILDYVDAHPDQWVGWTWWAAGPWWGGYSASIEPANGQDKPQTMVLGQHL